MGTFRYNAQTEASAATDTGVASSWGRRRRFHLNAIASTGGGAPACRRPQRPRAPDRGRGPRLFVGGRIYLPIQDRVQRLGQQVRIAAVGLDAIARPKRD